VGLLVGGYALGQGAIFAVQTWLVARGEYGLLAAFGTHFSFAMLSIFLIDAGSTTTLARQIARPSSGQAGDEFWPLFWATVVVRASIAMALGVAALAYALAFSPDPFSRYYLLSILPGLAVWTGNAVGLLDGLRLSGLSGVTGSIAFATSALALALAPSMPPHIAGAMLGCAFSLGYVLTVAAQWTALGRLGKHLQFHRPTRQAIVRAFRDGLALLSQFVPGQLILRVQLVLSTVYLGPESTALFVYAKQAVVAMTMLIGFMLRVDFPGLVEKMARAEAHSIGGIFEAQKSAMAGALFLTAGTLIVCLMVPLVPQYNLVRAAQLLMAYAPSIITILAMLVMMQGMAATGNYVSAAKIVAISTLVGAVVSYLAIGPFGIYGLLIGEVTVHLLACALLYGHLRSLR
jgi:O-antigen/teichoic acid export membrane protein